MARSKGILVAALLAGAAWAGVASAAEYTPFSPQQIKKFNDCVAIESKDEREKQVCGAAMAMANFNYDEMEQLHKCEATKDTKTAVCVALQKKRAEYVR